MKTYHAPWIKLAENLDREDYDRILDLQEQCVLKDQIALKLELDYKLGVACENTEKTDIRKIDEFMYFDGPKLIGYIGICSFGGQGSTLEITGMVHPEYRRRGIFSKLHELVMFECKRRNPGSILLLCDKKSGSGQSFIERIGAVYQYSEFEMVLQQDLPEQYEEKLYGITFRKAMNADALEIARQNTIYFGGDAHEAEPGLETKEPDMSSEKSASQDGMLLPEDEEKRGITNYLAEKDKRVIGKVNLQISAAVGGIYGLGVLPEHRGKGFGRAILLRSVEKLKEANVKEIMLQVAAENATALRLYKSCGFQETSTMDYFEFFSRL